MQAWEFMPQKLGKGKVDQEERIGQTQVQIPAPSGVKWVADGNCSSHLQNPDQIHMCSRYEI